MPSHLQLHNPLAATLVLLVAVAWSRATLASVRLGVLAGIAVPFMGCTISLMMIFNKQRRLPGQHRCRVHRTHHRLPRPESGHGRPDYLLIKPAAGGGDLLLLHAIGVHGLVLLAVPAVLLARTAMRPTRQLRVVVLAVAAVGVATGILAVHALRQLPWNQLSPLALAARVLCAVALLAAYRMITAAVWRRRQTEDDNASIAIYYRICGRC
ncbi:MAG TPA: hypothetical protein VNA67_10865 [Pseudonocardiaceae bacterium]|nr:hypothetical protein [Pseudonocardiaceae bacterium]